MRNHMTKKILAAALLLAALLLLSGCSVKEALYSVGQSYKDTSLDTPESVDGSIDWSFVPELREKANALFKEAAPDAEITETAVAMKNGKSDKVVVVVHYVKEDKAGTYGFQYEKNSEGAYELKRYGDGIDDDDL